MWPRKIRNVLMCLWLMGAPCFMAEFAVAQTPLDGQVTGLLSALRGPWGNLIVTLGVIALAITALVGIQHPAVFIYVGIGFLVLFLVGAALNGSMYAWIVGG